MNAKQSVVDALSKPANAAGVSGATVITGIGNMFEIVQPIIGGVAAILGIVVAWCVIKDYRQKRVLRALEIEAIMRVARFTENK